MNTITKEDFSKMVRLNHLEVITSEQLSKNTQSLRGYLEKALTEELSKESVVEANILLEDITSFDQWCVLRDDFSKAVVYTRPEQIVWEEAERGEFGEIIKAKGGIYKPTAENKKLGRVGQRYGKKEVEALSLRTFLNRLDAVHQDLIKYWNKQGMSEIDIVKHLKDHDVDYTEDAVRKVIGQKKEE